MTVEKWVPPILLDWWLSSKKLYGGYIWEGIYQNYRDVPTLGPGFSSERYAMDTIAYTRDLISASKNHGADRTAVFLEESFLALVVSMHAAGRQNGIRIVDFGGGMGVAYIHLLNHSFDISDIDYHIVDVDPVCAAGRDLFRNDPRIHFHSSLPTGLAGVDIVYICSALQYIEDYRGLLNALCAYRPKHFIFVKLSAGEIPTYATAQKNLPGTVVPYWFINVEEIKQIMKENRYGLIYRCLLDREYDQGNFPPKYRLGRACNLVFEGSTHEE